MSQPVPPPPAQAISIPPSPAPKPPASSPKAPSPPPTIFGAAPFDELLVRLKEVNITVNDQILEKDVKALSSSENALVDCLENFLDNLHISLFKMCLAKPSIELKNAVVQLIENLDRKEKHYLEKEKNGGLNAEEKYRLQNRDFSNKKVMLNEIVTHLEKPPVGQAASGTPTIVIKEKCFLSMQRTLSDYLAIGFEEDKNQKLMVDINLENYFKTSPPENVLATINEQYKTVTLLNVTDGLQKNIAINNHSNMEIPYSPSILVTPDSKIYAIGGLMLSNGNITNKAYRLKFEQNQCVLDEIQPMKVKRVGHFIVYLDIEQTSKNEKGESQITKAPFIYVIGGKTNNNVSTKICERYNITQDKWETIASMSFARSRPAVCSFNSKYIYAFFGSGSASDNVAGGEVFDVQANTWKPINFANMFAGLSVTFAGAVQVNKNEILIFGGFHEIANAKKDMIFSKKVLTYNTQTQIIRILPLEMPLDFALSTSSSPIVLNHAVYSLGFFLESSYPNVTRSLDYEYAVKVDGEKVDVKYFVCTKPNEV